MKRSKYDQTINMINFDDGLVEEDQFSGFLG